MLTVLQPYLLWLKVAFCASLFLGGFFVANYINEHDALKTQIAVATRTVVVERQAKAVSVKVAVAGQKAVAKIDEVFEQREKEMQHALDERGVGADRNPDETGGGSGGGLRLAVRTVCLWDSANAGVLPPAGCLDNEEASDRTIRDLERQHDREAAIAHKLEAHVIELQAWVCAQALLLNGEKAPFDVCQ
jgi:hypothetical protein